MSVARMNCPISSMNRPSLGHTFLLRCVGVVLLGLLGIGLSALSAQAQQKYAVQRSIPAEGDPRYDTPADVAFSTVDSTVYVADEGAGAVFRYRLDGTRRPPLRSVTVDGKTRSLEAPEQAQTIANAVEVSPRSTRSTAVEASTDRANGTAFDVRLRRSGL